jgi:hypothetical protein
LDKFPSIRHAINLLKVMEANPNFRAGTTLILTTNFLSRIESASPSAPDLSEDDTGISWGHHQFTSRSMTIKSILTSWESVGSTVMAGKLIAAGIKTCKVARHICFDNGITTSSYLADAYLSNMVDQLWDMWTAAGRVSITKNLGVRANSGRYESLYFIINNQIMVNTCQYLVIIMYSTIQSQYYNPHHQLRSVRHL